MSNGKNIAWTVVWGVISLGLLAFIITNSLRNGDESMSQSQWFVDAFRAIFDPNNTLSDDVCITIVRKTAHFAEFAALGLSVKAFLLFLQRLTEKSTFILPFFCGLFVAVSDEFIQGFSGRTSSVTDVLIDFAGSIVGILFITLIFKLIKKKTKYISIKQQ